MRTPYDLLRPDERAALSLRALYEQYGYKVFRMNRFEEYDFYAIHRDFLSDGQIITFTGLDGKLMALRPDVTLSIVKKTKAESGGCERLYYAEPVYRPSRETSLYHESFQVGVEYIGDMTPYASAEVVLLAQRSLGVIDTEYVLDISHTGYVGGLLAGLPIDGKTRQTLRRCIEEKNAHGIASAVAGLLGEEDVGRLQSVAKLSGPFPETLEAARALARGDAMLSAVEELSAVYRAASELGEEKSLRLDFSITSDAKYYSGLMLCGYVQGVPDAVLQGGRYDPLLKRMGKPSLSAMGFALYFDKLARHLADEADARVDTLVLYKRDTPPAQVAKKVAERAGLGETVFAATEPPADITFSRVVEVESNA